MILNCTKPAAKLTAMDQPLPQRLKTATLGVTATILMPDEAIHAYPVRCRW